MSTAQMDEASRAMCYALRNPGRGQKPVPLKQIRKMVTKKNTRKKPTLQAISQAAKTYQLEKMKRGRKLGQKKTTKQEDGEILKIFRKLRPPGHYVDSTVVRQALPTQLKQKVSRKLIIRRLADKGYTPQKKSSKTDLGRARMKMRVRFCKKHLTKNAAQWKAALHGVGDFKEFTWYPKEIQPTFKKLRSTWTYMTDAERKLPAFQRPKRWHKQIEWKKTKKIKVFGLTTSTGKQICFEVPHGKNQFNAAKWARFLKKRVAPFLQRCFPGQTRFQLLLDGEGLLHAPEAKRAMAECGIKTLPDWPGYSPELNPQEHVWSRAEPDLRALESGTDEYSAWKKKVLAAVKAYPSPQKLVGSMSRRVKTCLARQGAMLDC